MQLNSWAKPQRTYEGAATVHLTAAQQLSRTLMSCMLWEDEFYEDGQSIAARFSTLLPQVFPEIAAQMVVEARNKMKLRHAPLWLTLQMARLPLYKNYVANLLAEIIQRPAELAETLAMYWKDGKRPISAQVKKGLAKAFPKFSEYQLAKYDRAKEIKLRDVLFLCHAKPKDEAQAEVWKRLIAGTLATPDTWEVLGNSKETWEKLIAENKLGALALIRNLRNMQQCGVTTIREALKVCDPSRLFPYQLITAAKHAPRYEEELEALLARMALGKIPGRTVVLIDVSGSMGQLVSAKSEITRLEAACALAMIAKEMCEESTVLTFSERLVEMPPRKGFALRDAIAGSQPYSGTYLGLAIEGVNRHFAPYDRIIVITDEQSADNVPPAKCGKAYMINLSSCTRSVGYGQWHRIDGFSEHTLKYIADSESFNIANN